MGRSSVRRICISAAAAGLLLLPAAAARADKPDPGSQPGYGKSIDNSGGCSTNGTFAYLGGDLNPGQTTFNAGGEPGANGPATGDQNSGACGNNQS